MATIYPREGKRGTRWCVSIRLGGFPPEHKTFRTKTLAKRWAEKRENELLEGRFLLRREAERRSFAELVEVYLDEIAPYELRTKNLGRKAAQLGWWVQEIGRYRLSDVTPALISDCKRRLARRPMASGKRRCGATINRYLAALSRVLTVAVRELGWIDSNPARKVDRLPEPRGRVRFLSDEERVLLLEACRADQNRLLYPVVAVALGTGGRQSEVLGLEWQDVNLQPGLASVTFRDTKNGETRSVALEGIALDAVRRLHSDRRLGSAFVFPSKDCAKPAHIRHAFDRALAAGGIEDFRFHDLRHTFASYLAMSGATLAEIAEAMGHKTLVMVKRYAHLSESHTRQVVARMHGKFLTDPPRSPTVRARRRARFDPAGRDRLRS